MSKIVLVETVSMFRHIYAVELEDNQPADYAVEDVMYFTTGGETEFDEVAQEHVGENILSHRVVSEEEYLKMFDEMNPYFIEWSDEQKKKFIFKEVSKCPK
jgi:hypothetical protein